MEVIQSGNRKCFFGISMNNWKQIKFSVCVRLWKMWRSACSVSGHKNFEMNALRQHRSIVLIRKLYFWCEKCCHHMQRCDIFTSFPCPNIIFTCSWQLLRHAAIQSRTPVTNEPVEPELNVNQIYIMMLAHSLILAGEIKSSTLTRP